MTSPSLLCPPLDVRLCSGQPLALRWWHALRAGWQAARWALAQQAPAPAHEHLDALAHLDERTLADLHLPPETRARMLHARARRADGLWLASRGAVAPGVERSFY